MESPVAARFTGRVLLVDDNSINRLISGELLEQLGVQFESAEDGAEALEKLGAGQFELVLMDCLMPRMDGFTTTRRWREKERAAGRSRTPIVAVTANASSEDRERCLAAGMDDFLPKPMQRNRLATMIARYLRPAEST
jgi:CheY-like chemotaxis protein